MEFKLLSEIFSEEQIESFRKKARESDKAWAEKLKEYGRFSDLFEYFDSKKIIVEIGVDYTRQGYGDPLFCFKVTDWEDEEYIEGWSEFYRSRKEAESLAFDEAFKKLENR